jgi:hypothetical protein
MPKSKVIGFEASEVIGIPIMNYDFKGYTPQQAQQLVDEGKARWVLESSSKLALEMIP